MKTRFWELAGSKLGDIMKLKKQVEQDPDKHLIDKNGDFNYRAGSRYQTAIQRHT
jgi:pre-mRNA-splicing factor ATP-dependent RNA helicase DHX38/PRP16